MPTNRKRRSRKPLIPLESWEIEYMTWGLEPEKDGGNNSAAWGFLADYYGKDWRDQWEQARNIAFKAWLDTPIKNRPTDWIRELSEKGYVTKEEKQKLLGGK